MSKNKYSEELEELLSQIKNYPFTTDPFDQSKGKYSVAKLREVTKVISERVQDYVVRNANNYEFIKLVKPKVSQEDWGDYSRGELSKELIDAKTFERSLTKMNASVSTLNIFRAFLLVWEEEKEKLANLMRVAGVYYVYATHNTRAGKFQKSLLRIAPSGKSSLKYKDSNNKQQEGELETEVVSSSNLLLRLRGADHAIVFYVYIGGISQPSFIQAVFCYSNRMGNTITNLAVFERVPDTEQPQIIYEKFEGERELDEIPDDLSNPIFVDEELDLTTRKNIQQFLLYKGRPIATKVYDKTVPFHFGRLRAIEPGPYNKEARFYKKMAQLAGKYFIYFNERFPSIKGADDLFEKNAFFSTVGRGLLDIRVHEQTGALVARMRTRKNTKADLLTHQGLVINHKLTNSSCLILSLYLEPEKDRYLNLFFNVTDDEKLIGCYNIAYSPAGKLGSGTAIMVRTSLITENEQEIAKEDWDEMMPIAFLPYDNSSSSELEKKIINFLSKDQKALAVPPEYQELNRYKNNIYSGLYRMYSARETGGIKISLLRIHKNSSVVHYDPSVGEYAFGHVEKMENVLNITLKHAESSRAGFCCIKVDRLPPAPSKTFYGGTFAGISRTGDEIPIASQIILEFFDKEKSIVESLEQADRIDENTSKMEEIPSPLRKFFKNNSRKIRFERNIFKLDHLNDA